MCDQGKLNYSENGGNFTTFHNALPSIVTESLDQVLIIERLTWLSRNLFDSSVQGGDTGGFDVNIDNMWKVGKMLTSNV